MRDFTEYVFFLGFDEGFLYMLQGYYEVEQCKKNRLSSLITGSLPGSLREATMYTDKFIRAAETIDGIRMASLDDIAAMKINAISRGGRKKDFWDVHKLLERYTIGDMLELHKLRHPWEHDEGQVLKSLIDFSEANEMEAPVCLEGKDWDEIKLTFIDLVQDYDN